MVAMKKDSFPGLHWYLAAMVEVENNEVLSIQATPKLREKLKTDPALKTRGERLQATNLDETLRNNYGLRRLFITRWQEAKCQDGTKSEVPSTYGYFVLIENKDHSGNGNNGKGH